MKKLYLILAISILFSGIYKSTACTNFLVTPGASADGSAMITYSADAGGFFEPLFYMPAMDHEPGTMIDIYEWDTGKFLGQIPQVPHTYRVVGNMNEWQVSIGETTYGGRDELRDTTAIMDYGSLMYIALQRAKTAREAIDIMVGLVEDYGYYSSGESFSVADPKEVWIFEIISKGMKEKGAVWVARRVPDGFICAHANQARIREVPLNDPENTIFSEDVVAFAEQMGYYDPDEDGEFSFVDAYNPLEPGGLLFCEGRVWRLFDQAAPSLELNTDYWRAVEGAEPYPLFIKPDKKLTVQDVIEFTRDHFEGTEWDMTKGLGAGPYGCPYRWKNLVWQVEGDTTKYGWERPISTQQTAFSFVSQMRADMPREIGGCFWYGVDDNYSTVYMPLYSCMQRSPESLKYAEVDNFTFKSAAWVFNLVANVAYTKYSYIIKDIQEVQSEFENKFFTIQPAVEKAAMELYKQDKEMAIEYLSDYSINQVDQVVDRWRELWRYLVMKYNDGFINDVTKDAGRHPKGVGYGEEYFRQVIEERPGYYDIKWKKAD